VLEYQILGKNVKKHSQVLFCMGMCFFKYSCENIMCWWKHLFDRKAWETSNWLIWEPVTAKTCDNLFTSNPIDLDKNGPKYLHLFSELWLYSS